MLKSVSIFDNDAYTVTAPLAEENRNLEDLLFFPGAITVAYSLYSEAIGYHLDHNIKVSFIETITLLHLLYEGSPCNIILIITTIIELFVF